MIFNEMIAITQKNIPKTLVILRMKSLAHMNGWNTNMIMIIHFHFEVLTYSMMKMNVIWGEITMKLLVLVPLEMMKV